MSIEAINQYQCPECKSNKIISDDRKAEIYCGSCGILLTENMLDFGPEYRVFDHTQINRIRTGAPAIDTVHDKGLTTVIDNRDKDAHGGNVSNKAQWHRLRMWNKRARISGARERSLAIALNKLNRLSSLLSLPRSIRSHASKLYKQAADKKLIRGRSIDGVVATCLYIACRSGNIPRTITEISEVSSVTEKELGRTYRAISRKLDIKLSAISPKDYVARFASNLDLSNEVQIKAIEIIDDVKQAGLTSGKNPKGITAGALYIASILLSERRTQKEIADASGVTEVTIRNRYTEIKQKLDLGVVV